MFVMQKTQMLFRDLKCKKELTGSLDVESNSRIIVSEKCYISEAYYFRERNN